MAGKVVLWRLASSRVMAAPGGAFCTWAVSTRSGRESSGRVLARMRDGSTLDRATAVQVGTMDGTAGGASFGDLLGLFRQDVGRPGYPGVEGG